MTPGSPPLEVGPSALFAACLPDHLRGTDHGRALALMLGDIYVALTRGAHGG